MSPVPPEHDVLPASSAVQAKSVAEKSVLHENAIQLDSFVYNATHLAEIHPGGDLFVKVASILQYQSCRMKYGLEYAGICWQGCNGSIFVLSQAFFHISKFSCN